jgi:hypothetical protein
VGEDVGGRVEDGFVLCDDIFSLYRGELAQRLGALGPDTVRPAIHIAHAFVLHLLPRTSHHISRSEGRPTGRDQTGL